MHFAPAVLAAVAILGGLVSAAPAPPGRPPPGSNSASTRCYTKLATTQALWNTQTTWNTHYTPCTSTLIVLKTKTSTSTPDPITSTVTATTQSVIIANTTTLTATSTSTETITESTTTTSTSVSIIISTSTSTSTTTVAAPAGFTAIQTSLPGSTCDGSCDSVPDDGNTSKRDLMSRGTANGPFGAKGKGRGKSPWQYPKGVQCYAWQPQCLTKSVTSTATVVVTASPRTVTSTTTSISLVTSIPQATTTITTTALVTSTTTFSTDTFSVSTTIATASATSSVYAACASNNLAGLYNGMGIETANGDNWDTADFLSANDAYDCCVAAITDPNGQSVAWAYLIGSSSCTVALQNNGGTCSQRSSIFSLSLGDEDYVYGNGLCGEITSAGPCDDDC